MQHPSLFFLVLAAASESRGNIPGALFMWNKQNIVEMPALCGKNLPSGPRRVNLGIVNKGTACDPKREGTKAPPSSVVLTGTRV